MTDKTSNRLLIYSLVSLILMAGLYLRTVGVANMGLGFDEPIHIYAAKSLLENGDPVLPSGKVYSRALLFTYAVAGCFKLFGMNEMSARLPSIVSGILAILLAFFAGRYLFGSVAGVLAALLMAVTPYEIVFSRACRMYSMYQLFFLLTFFAFYRGFEGRSELDSAAGLVTYRPLASAWMRIFKNDLNWPWLMLAGISWLIAVHLQPLALSFGGGVLLYLFGMTAATGLRIGFKGTIRTKYFVFFTFAVIAAAILLATPYVQGKIETLVGFAPSWSRHSSSPYRYYYFLLSPTLFAVTVFLCLGSIAVSARMQKAGGYTLAVLAVPLFLHSFLVNVQQYRYIYDVFPLILIVAGYGIKVFFENEYQTFERCFAKRFPQWKMSKWRTVIVAVPSMAVLVVFFLPVLKTSLRISSIQGTAFGGEFYVQWRKGCAFLNRAYRPGDVIIASIPLAAEFYGCKAVDYSLDNGEIDQFGAAPEGGFREHPFSKTPAITNLQELRRVVALNPRGWLLLDAQRFRSSTTTPAAVREFILHNLIQHSTKADSTLHVFSWDKSSTATVTMHRR